MKIYLLTRSIRNIIEGTKLKSDKLNPLYNTIVKCCRISPSEIEELISVIMRFQPCISCCDFSKTAKVVDKHTKKERKKER